MPFLAEPEFGHLPQIGVYQRRQPLQGEGVAFAPFVQKQCNFPWRMAIQHGYTRGEIISQKLIPDAAFFRR
jgi:hypothetical protein